MELSAPLGPLTHHNAEPANTLPEPVKITRQMSTLIGNLALALGIWTATCIVAAGAAYLMTRIG